MSGWSSRPYSRGSTPGSTTTTSRGSPTKLNYRKSTTPKTNVNHEDLTITTAPVTAEDAEELEKAISNTAAEFSANSGFISKEELRRGVKKKLKKLDVKKEQMSTAVERAMDSITIKARQVSGELQRDRLFNTLNKITLKQYEGLSQGCRDLGSGLEDLNLTDVKSVENSTSSPRPPGKRYRRTEFQSDMDKMESIGADSERVCLQLRQLTDVMEQCVFDLERNIHQQTLYLSLP